MDLSKFPTEIWNAIIENLVITIGIKNAVLLRTINKAFNSAIMEAICISQVVDIHDPGTPYMAFTVEHSLRGKIALVKSRAKRADSQDLLSVIAKVNRTLDALTQDVDATNREKQHLAVAETVSSASRDGYSTGQPYDTKWDAQNLLCGAVVIGNLALVKSLLEDRHASNASTEVDGITPYFGRPLAIAAGQGHLGIVHYLLESGARANLIGRRDKTSGRPDEAENADYDPQNPSQMCFLRSGNTYPAAAPSALRAAVLGGHKNIVRELLLSEHRLAPSKTEYLSAIVASARVDAELIHMLVEALEGKHMADYPGLGQEMMWDAITYDRKQVVQLLLDEGCVDINAFPYPPMMSLHGALQWAAHLGNTDMMRFLLDRGADPNLNGLDWTGHSPVEGAAKSGQVEAVEMLLDFGADPALALRSAILESQPRIAKLVLEKYPDLLYRDGGHEGRSLLWYAVVRKNLRNITLLVDRGVSLNEGYEDPQDLPINLAKAGMGQWVVNHLLSIGAHDTDVETCEENRSLTTAKVRLEERTWQWVSKY